MGQDEGVMVQWEDIPEVFLHTSFSVCFVNLKLNVNLKFDIVDQNVSIV